jgi:hypothetical protein
MTGEGKQIDGPSAAANLTTSSPFYSSPPTLQCLYFLLLFVRMFRLRSQMIPCAMSCRSRVFRDRVIYRQTVLFALPSQSIQTNSRTGRIFTQFEDSTSFKYGKATQIPEKHYSVEPRSKSIVKLSMCFTFSSNISPHTTPLTGNCAIRWDTST